MVWMAAASIREKIAAVQGLEGGGGEAEPGKDQPEGTPAPPREECCQESLLRAHGLQGRPANLGGMYGLCRGSGILSFFFFS